MNTDNISKVKALINQHDSIRESIKTMGDIREQWKSIKINIIQDGPRVAIELNRSSFNEELITIINGMLMQEFIAINNELKEL